MSRHNSETHLNVQLFARIERLWLERDSLELSAEQHRVLQLYHREFVRAGARLQGDEREKMSSILERLASLGATFSQNVLKDERDWQLVLSSPQEKVGLPQWLIDAAAQAARERGQPGKHVITLARSLIEPFLQFSANRELREQAWRAWTQRGEDRADTDNRPIVAQTIALRIERAKLMGFPSFAHYKIDDQMAKSPDRVRELLMAVWLPARERALQERDALQALASTEGSNIQIRPWDWRYFAEKQRKLEHDLDENELKPYLPLDAVIAAAFDCAGKLFGLSFKERDDVPKPHPDARVWEVRKGEKHLAVFIGDYFARSSKRSGAWMSSYREQHSIGIEQRPIVCNTMNFAKGGPGEAALLTFDDARTLFHEFGHALHGMLSEVTFPMISGTAVSRDFVELPSQLFEHWLAEPRVLNRFARRVGTGEPMPSELIERLKDAQNFGQGFASVEYTASALVDLEMHLIEDAQAFDPIAFEQQVLDQIGMPVEIAMRHRVPHFTHVFSGDGYCAGYYSYMWAEVMDADAFAAFTQAGDIFDSETAKRLEETIYAAGGRQDPEDAYVSFRGRLPNVTALLQQRGFVDKQPGQLTG